TCSTAPTAPITGQSSSSWSPRRGPETKRAASRQPAVVRKVCALLHQRGELGRRARQQRVGIGEDQLVVRAEIDAHEAATLQLAEQQLLRERLLHVLLDDACQRPRPVERIETGLGEELAGR